MPTNAASDLLTSCLESWKVLLQQWSQDGRLAAAAEEALMLEGTPEGLQDLITQWSLGDFSKLPPIVLLSSADINGAMGAYAISTGTIYLNADWLVGASEEQVQAVLTEELGHHLDGLLNEADTPGDEGEYFSRRLRGEEINDVNKEFLRDQEDYSLININNTFQAVENALLFGSQIVANGSARVDLAHPTNRIELLSVDNGWGSAWWNRSIDLTKDWRTTFNVTAFNGSGTSDGFTFAINGDQRGTSAIGDGGQNLGFFGYDSGDGIRDSYAITFDMWTTQPASLLGFAKSTTTEIPQGNIDLSLSLSNNSYAVEIKYTAQTGILEVLIGGQSYEQLISLESEVGSRGYLGFTAANGGGTMDTDINTWDVIAEEAIASPVFRGNSLYTTVDGLTWNQAEENAVALGGHLVAIDNDSENLFVTNSFSDAVQDIAYIGHNDIESEGSWKLADGSNPEYFNWAPGEPSNNFSPVEEDVAAIYFREQDYGVRGVWNDVPVDGYGNINKGISEIYLTLSINLPTVAKEGAGVFTTSINLSAGTFNRTDLVEGAQVFWKVTGITAEDLESGALIGSGVISNGKLDIAHSLVQDADSDEQFEVSVFSDAEMTQQIGTTSSVDIEDTRPTPLIRGSSFYTIIDSTSWISAEQESISLGGHLMTVNDQSENDYLTTRIRDQIFSQYSLRYGSGVESDQSEEWRYNPMIGYSDYQSEGEWKWSSGELAEYTNWYPGEPNDFMDADEDYAIVYLFGDTERFQSFGMWNDSTGGTIGIGEIPFIRRGDSAYVIVQGPTWEEAEANANKLGGHLVTINDAEENDWIYENLYAGISDGIWLGATDKDQEGIWKWSDGTPWSYSNFITGQPDNFTGHNGIEGEDYLHFNAAHGSQWNDISNGYPDYPFRTTIGIAEIKLAPNNAPTGTPTLSGTFKTGQFISIDKTPIQDADNFTGYTPTYNYSWEISSDNGSTWTPLTTADAIDNNSTYTLTTAEVGKQIRGVVKYLDGYGTNEIVRTSASQTIEYDAPDYTKDNTLIITSNGAGTLDGVPFSDTFSFDLAQGNDTATIEESAGTNLQMTVEGGEGTDTLNGNALKNTLILSGINEGTLDGLAFRGFENVNLGSGNDVVYILSGGMLSGLLNGGSGGTIIYVPPGGDPNDYPPDGGGGDPGTEPPPPTGDPITLPPTPPGFKVNGGLNSIYLNDDPNTVILTGSGSGVVDGTDFINFYALDLRGGNDSATINTGGSLFGVLKGGEGTDTLDLSSAINVLTIDESLIGSADSTKIDGFEVINLLEGNDSAAITINALPPSFTGTRKTLILDGGTGTDSLTLKLTKEELDYLQSQGTLSTLQTYLSNPTGNSITIALTSIDLTLSGFEGASFFNRSPYKINLSRGSAPENLPTSEAAAILSSDDDDPYNNFIYELVAGTGDADNDRFVISGNELRFKSSPDAEEQTTYNLRLKTTDQGGLSYEEAFTFEVTDVNEAPTNLNLTETSFNENIIAGSAVATLSSIDPDAADTHTYSLVSGTGSTDNSAFTIDGSQLKINASPDFESKPSYSIRIRTTDAGGLSFEKEVVLNVLNVNEAPTNLNLTETSFNENITAGSAVATLSSIDPDAADTHTYSLVSGTGSTDNSAFTIDGTQLKINASPDFESKPSYSVRIRTTDAGGLFFDKSVTLTVNNLPESGNYTGTGNTNLTGTAADDTYTGTNTNNSFNGLGGYDRASRSGDLTNYTVSGTTATAVIESITTVRSGRTTSTQVSLLDTLTNTESVQITGGNSNNTINAGGGTTNGITRSAFSGTFIAYGGTGVDTITGGTFKNWMAGQGFAAGITSGIETITGTTNTSNGAMDIFDLRNSSLNAPAYVGGGNADYARIANFNAGTDKLVLTGTEADYRFALTTVTSGGKVKTVTDQYWAVSSAAGDLIAQVRGNLTNFSAATSVLYGTGDHTTFAWGF